MSNEPGWPLRMRPGARFTRMAGLRWCSISIAWRWLQIRCSREWHSFASIVSLYYSSYLAFGILNDYFFFTLRFLLICFDKPKYCALHGPGRGPHRAAHARMVHVANGDQRGQKFGPVICWRSYRSIGAEGIGFFGFQMVKLYLSPSVVCEESHIFRHY